MSHREGRGQYEVRTRTVVLPGQQSLGPAWTARVRRESQKVLVALLPHPTATSSGVAATQRRRPPLPQRLPSRVPPRASIQGGTVHPMHTIGRRPPLAQCRPPQGGQGTDIAPAMRAVWIRAPQCSERVPLPSGAIPKRPMDRTTKRRRRARPTTFRRATHPFVAPWGNGPNWAACRG